MCFSPAASVYPFRVCSRPNAFCLVCRNNHPGAHVTRRVRRWTLRRGPWTIPRTPARRSSPEEGLKPPSSNPWGFCFLGLMLSLVWVDALNYRQYLHRLFSSIVFTNNTQTRLTKPANNRNIPHTTALLRKTHISPKSDVCKNFVAKMSRSIKPVFARLMFFIFYF